MQASKAATSATPALCFSNVWLLVLRPLWTTGSCVGAPVCWFCISSALSQHVLLATGGLPRKRHVTLWYPVLDVASSGLMTMTPWKFNFLGVGVGGGADRNVLIPGQYSSVENDLTFLTSRDLNSVKVDLGLPKEFSYYSRRCRTVKQTKSYLYSL